MSEPTACADCGVVKPPCCFDHSYRQRDMCRPCASAKNKKTRDRAKRSPAGLARAKRERAKLIAKDNAAYADKVAQWAERKGAS